MDFKCECGRVHTIKVETLKAEPSRPIDTAGLRLTPKDVRAALMDADVSINQSGGRIIIRSNRRLENDEWRFVMDYVKVNGGQWITDGSNSRWEI